MHSIFFFNIFYNNHFKLKVRLCKLEFTLTLYLAFQTLSWPSLTFHGFPLNFSSPGLFDTFPGFPYCFLGFPDIFTHPLNKCQGFPDSLPGFPEDFPNSPNTFIGFPETLLNLFLVFLMSCTVSFSKCRAK